MRPVPASTIERLAATAQWNEPLTLTAHSRSRSSSRTCSAGTFSVITPAAHTSAPIGPSSRDHALGGSLDALAVGHVAADREGAASVGLDPGDGLGLALGVAVDAGHVGAHLRERHGHGLADALRGACHDRHRARQVEGDRVVARAQLRDAAPVPPRSMHPLIR